jgi:hypothetical protein
MRPLIVVAAVLVVGSTLCSAATITIEAGAGLAGNAAALAAFNRAALAWSSRLSDPITVTVNADLATLGNPSVIGSASSVMLGGAYTAVRDQLVADASDEADDAIVASLPTAAQFNASMNAGFSLDGNIFLTKANAKALGYQGMDFLFGLSDGTITFNDQFAFDYDNSNGVTPGTMDFETVAAHEIGHTLGFFSMVDTIDANISTPGAIGISTLDLFRFPANAGVTAANFSTATRSLVAGQEAEFSDAQHRYNFSTGVANGDGRQASHWKDDALLAQTIGTMDPTLGYVQVFPITYADLRALDVIGWDFTAVPEPGSIGLLSAGLCAVMWLRRRA